MANALLIRNEQTDLPTIKVIQAGNWTKQAVAKTGNKHQLYTYIIRESVLNEL